MNSKRDRRLILARRSLAKCACGLLVLLACTAKLCAQQAPRDALDARLRHAATELLVAALDELMLLDEQQRDEMRKLLADERLGAWRPSTSWEKLLCADRAAWQTTLARGALAIADLPRSELASILRPSQLAVVTDLRVYALRLGNGRHPPVAHRRKEPLFRLSIEYFSTVCEISDEERSKLVLASKLDLAGKFSEPEAYERAKCSPPVDEVLPAGLASSAATAYGKMRQRLTTAERSGRLKAASQARWRFHQAADLESIVAALQRTAGLTAEQCEALFQLFRKETPEVAGGSYIRLETFAAVARIPPARWTPLLEEFQAKSMTEQMRALDRAVAETRRREAAEP